uniref:Acetyl-coenzyme A carboxylase carboxyl transferase subunit beta, chloroplastic n=1 Tax=Arceuthobium oxycedri TaxID=35989 RepID=A0A7T1HF49_9MAGN|nr:acetyl-CoA carboxylase carboxyltransferase beta subunit [Arceuthobium oxycedri]QPN54444.1 acetyl-CoA carboxylase carboxyltransferase beta subunit [Arceuthobium oxycedri]
MNQWWFINNSMLFDEELEHELIIGFLGPIKTSRSEDQILNNNGGGDSNYSYSTIYDFCCSGRDIVFNYESLLVKDRHKYGYYIFFDLENLIFEVENYHSFLSYLENKFTSSHNPNDLERSKSDSSYYDSFMYDKKYRWKNHIINCIDSLIHYQFFIEHKLLKLNSHNHSYNYRFCDESRKNRKSDISSSMIKNITTNSDFTLKIKENSNDSDVTQKYSHLWVQCENCYGLNYKKFFKSKMNICEQCGTHLKMNSLDTIELLIDPGTWDPMDEDIVSLDPIEFHSEKELYKDRINSYQIKTGLIEAVQTGIGQLKGIPIAIGVMDFQFIGGSMGSVVGEKITRLIEYASHQFLPILIVCASGGARMQEGSLSLMQMAKISASLYDFQSYQKLFYLSILTSPTTGGVTASFGMLGDIIIAEPNSYIAFAGKRVIEQTLNKTVPEGSQSAEHLFNKGLFDSIVPRTLLKSVLKELFQLHISQ